MVNENQWVQFERYLRTPDQSVAFYMKYAYHWLGWGIHGNRTHYAYNYVNRFRVVVPPVKVSTLSTHCAPSCRILRESKQSHQMQLTSKRHSMVVEFRPHNILTDKFVYTLKFKGDTQSMRLFSKKEMIETCNSRLDIHGYQVTDFLTEPQSYMPAAC